MTSPSTNSFSLVPDFMIRKLVARSFSEMYSHELPEYNRFTAPVKESNLNALPGYPEIKREALMEEKHGAIRVPGPTEMRIVTRIFAQMGMVPVEFYDMTILGEKSLPMIATAFRPVDATIEESAFRMFCSMLHIDSIPPELRREILAELENNRKVFPKFSSDLLAMLAKAERHGGLAEADAKQFAVQIVDAFSMHKDKVVDFALYSKLRKLSDPLADIVLESPVLNHLTPRALNIKDAVSKLVKSGIPMQTVIQGPPLRDDGVPVQLNQIARIAAGEDVYVASKSDILAAFKSNPDSLSKLKDSARRIELQQDETVADYMERIRKTLDDADIVIIQHKARFGEIESRGVALTVEGETAYNAYNIEGEMNLETKKAKIAKFNSEFPKTHHELHDKGWAYYTYQITPTGQAASEDGSLRKMDVPSLLKSGYINLVPQTYNDFLPFSAAAIFAANLTTGTEGIGDRPKNATNQNKKALEDAMGTSITSRHELHQSDLARSLRKIYRNL